MKQKELDGLLRDWAAFVIQSHDSGYPSDYTLKQRINYFSIYTPNYFPNHKVNQLSHAITILPLLLRNIIVGKYIYKLEMKQMAEMNNTSRRTVYRKLDDARQQLLDEMAHKSYNSTILAK